MTAQVFVTTYALYNEGFQFANDKSGFWIDCQSFDADEMNEHFINVERDLLGEFANDDPELMFTDYEGFPEPLYSESGIKFELVNQYEELDEEGKAKIKHIMDYIGADFEEALDKMVDYRMYEGSKRDWAYDEVNELHSLDDFTKRYFDYDAYARDMDCEGVLIEISHNLLLICYNR